MTIDHVLFQDEDGVIPNNPRLPVLLYRSVLPPDETDRAAVFERHFSQNNWGGLWRNGIYDYHHFHAQAHEVLGIAEGTVTVQLGGGSGQKFDLKAGDMVILPAGTGHKNLQSSKDLLVVGGYPAGQEMDICKSIAECPGAKERIAATPLPKKDPFYGGNGPLIKTWN